MPRNWEEVRSWLASGAADPLSISCPRCARAGLVRRDGDATYVIDWHDEARGWRWRDDAVTADELGAPDFGCGYDRRAENGFVGGAPFVRALK